jgi:hypothetical protein
VRWTGLSASSLKNNTEKQLFLVSDSGPSWPYCLFILNVLFHVHFNGLRLGFYSDCLRRDLRVIDTPPSHINADFCLNDWWVHRR